MSESIFNTLKHVILDQDSFERLNLNSDAVVAINSYSMILSVAPILHALKRDIPISTLMVSHIEVDISFTHSVQELLGGTGSNFGTLVGLEGWGSSETSTKLDTMLFSHNNLAVCPSKDALCNASSATVFKELALAAGSSCTRRIRLLEEESQ